jgi:hypothetical protein
LPVTRIECFLDTNILLHYKPLDEIDWLALTTATEVVLSLPSKVIAELDDKKETGSPLRLRKRAQDALRRLRSWRLQGEQPTIREGVALRFIPHEPRIDWEELGLDPAIPDDRIIAAVLRQGLGGDFEARLVTADLGPELKIQPHGIGVLSLPDEHRLPEVMSEHDQELNQARQRLALLEHREPKLRLELEGPTGRAQPLRITLAHPRLQTPEEIESAIRAEESDLRSPLRTPGSTVPTLAMFADPRDRHRFEQEIPEYLTAYREYLEKRNAHQVHTAWMVKLQCIVVNDGHAPAEGVHLLVHVPDGPDVFSEQMVSHSPKPPKRPTPPQTTAERMLRGFQFGLPADMLRSFDYLRDIPRVGAESREPLIKKTNSYVIEHERNEIKHGFETTFEPFYCAFLSQDDVKSFSMQYEIHARNLAEPVDGELHLILQVG